MHPGLVLALVHQGYEASACGTREHDRFAPRDRLDVKAKISLDTGSNRGVSLFPEGLDLKGIRAALVHTGKVGGAGARGGFTSDKGQLNLTMGVGDFMLPAGREVVTLPDQSKPGIAANIGNPTFADLQVKLVIDYPAKKLAIYGDCGK